MAADTPAPLSFRDPGAARAGGLVLAAAALLVTLGLIFHPVPAGGFEERASVLQNTNPLFLLGLTILGVLELRRPWLGLPRWLAWIGAAAAVLSWGRGIGSATGLYFLEPLIVANVPAFLWLGYVGLVIARAARDTTS